MTSIRLISSITSRKHWLLYLMFFVFFNMEGLASPASDGRFTAHSLRQGILDSDLPNQQKRIPLVPDQFYASDLDQFRSPVSRKKLRLKLKLHGRLYAQAEEASTEDPDDGDSLDE